MAWWIRVASYLTNEVEEGWLTGVIISDCTIVWGMNYVIQ